MQNSDRVLVEFRDGVTETEPIIPRRYTYVHKDKNKEAILTIGEDFVYNDAIDLGSPIFGEWMETDSGIWFYVYLNMDGSLWDTRENLNKTEIQSRLLHTLVAIRQGDEALFEAYPELLNYPIVVSYLYSNTELNYQECWGTFANYNPMVVARSLEMSGEQEYHVLLNEKRGDVTGDGTVDQVTLYGDKSPYSYLISNLRVEVEGENFRIEFLTDLNGYEPTLFLGDFTKDGRNDILISTDHLTFNHRPQEHASVGVSMETVQEKGLTTIFTSKNYNREYRFYVEFVDFYKVRIVSVKDNRIFFLDISYKGIEYLSKYYTQSGSLIRPIQAYALEAEAYIPVIGNKNEVYFDLLVLHPVFGADKVELLGYIENVMSWENTQFQSIRMVAATPGTELIKSR